MPKNGIKRVRRIQGTASTRTFGASSPVYTPFNLDAGFGFPDQNAEGFPEDCSIYTQNELCQDEDGVRYDRSFLKEKVLLKTGHQGPYDINDSLEATIVYGVKPEGGTPDQAYAHRRGRDFRLEKISGMDWYDSAISVMQTTRRSLSLAGPWFPSFDHITVFPENFPLSWPDDVPGHDMKVYGLNSSGYLTSKTWQGTWFGNKGESYWTRAGFNRYLSMAGTGAFMLSKYEGSVTDIQYGTLYTLKFLISLYIRRMIESLTKPATVPPQAPVMPQDATLPASTTSMPDWDNQKNAYHNTRVISDRIGLTLDQKNVLCACIYQESKFLTNPRPNQNKDKTGKVWSTDFGICQVNDYFHIGPGKDFPSIEYVLSNPEKVVEWMASIYKRTGALQPWASYTSKAYLQWLSASSPMWDLKS